MYSTLFVAQSAVNNLVMPRTKSTAEPDYTETLIELVRERPALWQKKHKNYKDTKTVKNNNWEDVRNMLREELESDTLSSKQIC